MHRRTQGSCSWWIWMGRRALAARTSTAALCKVDDRSVQWHRRRNELASAKITLYVPPYSAAVYRLGTS